MRLCKLIFFCGSNRNLTVSWQLDLWLTMSISFYSSLSLSFSDSFCKWWTILISIRIKNPLHSYHQRWIKLVPGCTRSKIPYRFHDQPANHTRIQWWGTHKWWYIDWSQAKLKLHAMIPVYLINLPAGREEIKKKVV